MKVQKGLTQPQ